MNLGPGIFFIAAIVGGGFILLVGIAIMIKNFYKKVAQGEALINNKTGGKTEVSFTGGLVLPIVHRAEVMDISLKTIELDRRGKEGLICADKIRADIKVTFFVRVNQTVEDVKKVAQSIGCVRASNEAVLEVLFLAKFSEALKTVGYSMRFEDLYKERDAFKESILREIGQDLNGYIIDDAAIDYLEQTRVEDLDPENILDSEGIRAITEITAMKAVETNRLRNDEKKRITKQNVETREAVLQLEKQQANAEATQAREVANVRAREKAEIDKVAAEEHMKAEEARIAANQEIQVSQENMSREVEVAQKNRERVIAVETERVERERQLEVIGREREVELNRIEKEKALEAERKAIADIIRGRVAVDKTVAEEEERIKDLRANAEANRNRDVRVIGAEAEAQESLVKDIKAAEAAEKASAHKAKERLVLAEAELEAADKEAKAKIRRADGLQAEVAAPGLAQVKVKEADAVAAEKKGMVDVRLIKEKLVAEAEGNKEKGAVEAEVRERLAQAALAEGQAKAKVEREQLEAVAKGEEEQGLAKARVREAEAVAIQKTGEAQALAIAAKGKAEAEAAADKFAAEARGLSEKAASMKELDGVGREHEEFRLALEKERLVELEEIAAKREIAAHQAKVMGTAFANAKIDIVGGDGQFFDRFVGAVGMGKSMDGFISKSNTAKTVLKSHLNGDQSLVNDIKDVLANPKVSTGDIQKLTVSTFLAKMMANGDSDTKEKIEALVAKARELGIDGLTD